MKFVSYGPNADKARTGLFLNNKIYDLQKSAETVGLKLPTDMLAFLNGGERMMDEARKVEDGLKAGSISINPESSTTPLLSPVPKPTSCRDGYAFRQHVATARRNRGVEMIPEFDQYPVFYFTNHNGVAGEGDIELMPDHFQKLDFELEAAIVIGSRGRNIKSSEADKYIAGYTIMNDVSARVLQMEEMRLNLGPAKGKDFATTLGPWMVTPDELESKKINSEFGNGYDLRMTAHHNGTLISDGNLKDMNWTFAEIIERCSYGVDIFPGDVIGSGTVGTGCYLELNGTRTLEAKQRGEEYTPVWLQDGDTIDLEIESLGKLSNRTVASGSDWSILGRKKVAETA